VTDVVQNLETAQQKQVAAAAVNALPQADQEDVAATVLGRPDRKTQQILWYLVVAMMGGAIFVFGVLTFVLTLNGRSAEGVVALATTALGGVVGLVSTGSASARRAR
jgi:hypothetical protein